MLKNKQQNPQTCTDCDDSGEGMFIGTICHVCKGLGEVETERDNDE